MEIGFNFLMHEPHRQRRLGWGEYEWNCFRTKVWKILVFSLKLSNSTKCEEFSVSGGFSRDPKSTADLSHSYFQVTISPESIFSLFFALFRLWWFIGLLERHFLDYFTF